MVADIHKKYILAVPGFNVVETTPTGNAAIEFLQKNKVSLIVLDIFMPEMNGIETLKKIRELEIDVDIIMITAAKENHNIKEVLRFGAFDYIIKPFTFERLKASLESYKKHFLNITAATENFKQEEIDVLFAPKIQYNQPNALPKGLHASTLNRIIHFLREEDSPLSADEVAQSLGVSRVTVRRYLEYLVASGDAVMENFYQTIGRPINKFKLLKE